MKILVISDTHGSDSCISYALAKERNAEVVIHCGDGGLDVDDVKYDFPDKMFICVKGNNDFARSLELYKLVTLGGKKIFVTHGHYHDVRYSPYSVCLAAQEKGADICLFGHTHIPYNDIYQGMYVMNPGSLKYKGTYGVIDIEDGKISTRMGNI